MKVYLSGPITSVGVEVAEKQFSHFAEILEARGFEVINPFDVLPFCDAADSAGKKCDPEKHMASLNHSWGCWMRQDIIALAACDAIAMMPGWGDSRGAKLEYQVAVGLEMPVIIL